MPRYQFKCANGHVFEVELPMDADHNQADCEECQLVGSRVYTPANVNWGGCPPSKGDIPEAARVLKRDASKNRDEYERRHENASHS